MSLLAPLDREAAELYLLRFVLQKNAQQILFCEQKYAPLIEFAQLEWAYSKKKKILVSSDCSDLSMLTSAHFNLIQRNADAFSQLFIWFPPSKPFADADELRLLGRCGVQLHNATRLVSL